MVTETKVLNPFGAEFATGVLTTIEESKHRSNCLKIIIVELDYACGCLLQGRSAFMAISMADRLSQR